MPLSIDPPLLLFSNWPSPPPPPDAAFGIAAGGVGVGVGAHSSGQPTGYSVSVAVILEEATKRTCTGHNRRWREEEALRVVPWPLPPPPCWSSPPPPWTPSTTVASGPDTSGRRTRCPATIHVRISRQFLYHSLLLLLRRRA